jgi:hypothetical protein
MPTPGPMMEGPIKKSGLGEEKKKSRMFVPLTIKMINEAHPRPDDIFEIDGAPINEVN